MTWTRRMCRGCGCTDDRACLTEYGPCAWTLLDVTTPTGICSVCAEELDWHQDLMIELGRDQVVAMAATLRGSARGGVILP